MPRPKDHIGSFFPDTGRVGYRDARGKWLTPDKFRVYTITYSIMMNGKRVRRSFKIDTRSEKEARASAKRIFESEYRTDIAQPKIIKITSRRERE